LTETKITSLDDACQVAKKLHALGSPHVVITTLSLPLKDVPAKARIESSSEESLYTLTSQLHADGQVEQYLIAFPTFPGYFTGTGDLFSSLCVARFQESIEKNGRFVDAIYRVVCSVNAIVQKTYAYQKKRIQLETNGQSDSIDSKPSAASLVRSCELRLIQGKKEIEDPDHFMAKGLLRVVKI
jgi:pyridoxine kinase